MNKPNLRLLGFTLIELLISIAILGILATIGFGNFQTARLKAVDAKKKSDLQSVTKSLEAYVNDHQSYPLSNANGEIICQPDTNTACPWGEAFTDGSSLYAASLPTTNTGYVYSSTDGTNYTLYTALENTKDPSLTTFTPEVSCGNTLCNYKITSPNIN